MNEPGKMNIYWTQIKLRAAANQAIYFIINFTTRQMQDLNYEGEWSVSLYMPINLFYELNRYEDISYADPLRLWGGQRPPLPLLIDAHAVRVQNFPIEHFGKENGNTLRKVQESTTSVVGDKHQASEGWKCNTNFII